MLFTERAIYIHAPLWMDLKIPPKKSTFNLTLWLVTKSCALSAEERKERGKSGERQQTEEEEMTVKGFLSFP